MNGHRDADATLVSPMLVGIADGVSQIEEFGIDASELPNELLGAIEELAVGQLLPDKVARPQDQYRGPINMLKEAYESTESMGSTTLLMAIMDNSSQIHGKLHPMIAVCSVGDCEMLILRRNQFNRLEPIFHTEMQRVDGNAQSPLQIARVDDSIDPEFDESIAVEVIERGSAVHCVSAFEGDIVVLGSDGVFDNLFIEEIVTIADDMLRTPYNACRERKFVPAERALLGRIARAVVEEAHNKTQPDAYGHYPRCPIGRGGKVDDTSCLVGEVVEWTDAHSEAWKRLRRERKWNSFVTCGGTIDTCRDDSDKENNSARVQNYPNNPNASFSTYMGSFSEYQGSFAALGPGSFVAPPYKNGGAFHHDMGSEYGSSFASQSEYGGERRCRSSNESDGKCSMM